MFADLAVLEGFAAAKMNTPKDVERIGREVAYLNFNEPQYASLQTTMSRQEGFVS